MTYLPQLESQLLGEVRVGNDDFLDPLGAQDLAHLIEGSQDGKGANSGRRSFRADQANDGTSECGTAIVRVRRRSATVQMVTSD